MGQVLPRPVRQTIGPGTVPVASIGTAVPVRKLLDPSLPGPVPLGVSPIADADETYRLAIDGSGITCVGRSGAGLARAGATLAQLCDGADEVACQVIDDHPRFAWRGLTVDLARSFRTMAELHEIVDLLALYKLNVLHLHLTDHEAWRLELPGYPELVRQARTHDPGHYTLAEYRELQAYAAQRYVAVVPEIDLPGHCGALTRAIPGLAQLPRPAGLAAEIPLVTPLELADARTGAVVAEILEAVAAVTDGQFVHFGADEAFGSTEDSFRLACESLRAIVESAGKRTVAWQEAARAGAGGAGIVQQWISQAAGDLPRSEEEFEQRPELAASGLTWPIVTALWRHFERADQDIPAALAGGAAVLLSSQSHLYLDRPYDPQIVPPDQQEPARRLGFPHYRPQTVAAVADWDPFSEGVPPERIAGVEATLFAEGITSFDDFMTLTLPRLPVIAQTAWSPEPSGWSDLSARLATHAPLWRRRGWAYLASVEIGWD